MKNILLGLLFLSSLTFYAQISKGGYPTTFNKNVFADEINASLEYEVKNYSKPNLSQISQEDQEASIKGEMYRIGVLTPVSISFVNSGTWKTMSNGDRIWRLGIKVPDAMALSLYFAQEVIIPKGGKLHAYNKSHSQYVGAYTSETPAFKAMEMIEGDFITLEYLMPSGSTIFPTIEIANVGYYYRGVEDRIAGFRDANPDYFLKADPCQVDVACSETIGWEDQRDAVVQYTMISNISIGVCTGTLINNTANDCKPYILTANHCGEPTSNGPLANDVFYFNYQRPTCSPGSSTVYNGAKSQTMTGATLLASSELGTSPSSSTGGVIKGADFALLELKTAIPSAYNPYYAGWNRSATASTSGVGIHHPQGHEKKISTYTNSVTTSTYGGNGWSGAHWKVFWGTTTNGHGVTEGGSSGSPLFNPNGLIVGHLSGGASDCLQTGAPDYYGKMNKAWDEEGNNANQRLKPWLDPSNTGVTTLEGSYNPCAAGTTCLATSTNCDEYIENVSLNTINKTSGCNNYSNFTSISTTLVKGESYDLTITPNIVGSAANFYEGDHIAAWIDWNNDGDFTDNGERVGYVLATTTGWSNVFNFTVPSSASNGSKKMRVRISYEPNNLVMSPCGTTSEGEVEDYTINVTSANSISENDLNLVSIYPNPTNNRITIDLENNFQEVTEISVSDITGRIVTTLTEVSSQIIINLTSEPSGIYLVKLKAKSGIYTHKVIKF